MFHPVSNTALGSNKPIEEIEAGLLPASRDALDELMWWAKATMAARTLAA